MVSAIRRPDTAVMFAATTGIVRPVPSGDRQVDVVARRQRRAVGDQEDIVVGQVVAGHGVIQESHVSTVRAGGVRSRRRRTQLGTIVRSMAHGAVGMAPHDHPLFTQVYRLIARAEDSGAVGKARTEVSTHLHGRLLIVGLGPAEDLHHLPDTVTEVVGWSRARPCEGGARGGRARRDAGGGDRRGGRGIALARQQRGFGVVRVRARAASTIRRE